MQPVRASWREDFCGDFLYICGAAIFNWPTYTGVQPACGFRCEELRGDYFYICCAESVSVGDSREVRLPLRLSSSMNPRKRLISVVHEVKPIPETAGDLLDNMRVSKLGHLKI